MKHFQTFYILIAILLGACTSTEKTAGNNIFGLSQSMPEASIFLEPKDESKPWCYWWWMNGNIDAETITRDLENMKEIGFGGVLIFDARGYHDTHVIMPKPQCDFMDATWRKNFKFAVKEAERLGLKVSVNLSSCAGALKGPWLVGEDAPKRLICKIIPLKSGEEISLKFKKPEDRKYFKDIATFAVKYDGEKFTKESDWLNAGDGLYTMKAASGKRIDAQGVSTRHTILEQIDLANTDAFKVTCEGNWAIIRFAWTTIDGHDYDVDVLDTNAVAGHYHRMADAIKSDIGNSYGKTLISFYSVSWEGAVPTWSGNFPADFKKFAGYEIRKFLPILAGFDLPNKSDSAKFMTDFRRTRNDIFRNNFYGNMANIAHSQGLKWHSESGGPWVRNPPVFGEADQLAYLAINDMPQGEFWPTATQKTKASGYGRYLIKPIANTANIYGNKLAAVEAFTHMRMHWYNFPALLKPTADRMFTDGGNFTIWHTYTASPKRFGKPGIEYFAGTHVNTNVTWNKQVAPFLKYIARSQYLLRLGNTVSDFCIYMGDTPYQHWGNYINKPYNESKLNIPNGYSYDIVNNDILLSRAKIKNGELSLGAGKTYKALIVDLQRPYASPEALKKICELKESGLPIIVSGDRPKGASLLTQDSYLAKTLGDKIFDGAPSLESWLKTSKLIPDASGNFSYIHRRINDCDIYFVNGKGKLCGNFRAKGNITLWNPLDGSIVLPDKIKVKENSTEVEFELDEQGGMFVVFNSGVNADSKAHTYSKFAEIKPPFKVFFQENRGAPASANFDKLIAWNESDNNQIKYFSGEAVYTKTFELSAQDASKPMAINLGEIGVVAEVEINGEPCGTLWVPPYRTDITGKVKAGKNTLKIKVINTWVNRLIGDASLPENERITKSNIRLEQKRTRKHFSSFAANDKLQTSGLLGPVTLEFIK